MTDPHVAHEALAWLAGTLPDPDARRIRDHLATCAACREEVADVERAVRALEGWRQPPPLADAREQAIARAAVRAAHRPVPARRTLAAAALAAVCALGGFAAGRATAATIPAPPPVAGLATATPPSDTTLPAFILLLEERAWPPPAPLARDGYREWARTLAAARRYAGGEKLTEEPGWRLASDGTVSRPEAGERPPNMSGWFLVRARDYEDALRIAREGPHLRYGSVLVRQVE